VGDADPSCVEKIANIQTVRIPGGTGYGFEQGEIEDSQIMEREGDDQPDLTQQSSNGVETKENEREDEELLDYEEDPALLEQAQMADLERNLEARATKLIEDMVVTLP
jgi:hypothetical protein